MAKRALGLFRERSTATPQEIVVAAFDRRWGEALKYACDMSNMYVKSSLGAGMSAV